MARPSTRTHKQVNYVENFVGDDSEESDFQVSDAEPAPKARRAAKKQATPDTAAIRKERRAPTPTVENKTKKQQIDNGDSSESEGTLSIHSSQSSRSRSVSPSPRADSGSVLNEIASRRGEDESDALSGHSNDVDGNSTLSKAAKPKAALSRGTKRKVSVYSDSEEDAYSDDDESDYTDDIGKKGMKKNNSVEVTVTTVKKPSVAKNTAAPKEAGRPSTKVRKAATAAKAKAKSTIQKPAAKKSPAVTSPAKRLAVASPAKRNAPLGSLLSSPTKAQAVRPKLTMGSSSSSLSSSSLLSHTNQTPATRQKLGRGTGRSGGASLRDLLAGSHAPRAGLSRRVRK